MSASLYGELGLILDGVTAAYLYHLGLATLAWKMVIWGQSLEKTEFGKARELSGNMIPESSL